jgi:hypothetical protein
MIYLFSILSILSLYYIFISYQSYQYGYSGLYIGQTVVLCFFAISSFLSMHFDYNEVGKWLTIIFSIMILIIVSILHVGIYFESSSYKSLINLKNNFKFNEYKKLKDTKLVKYIHNETSDHKRQSEITFMILSLHRNHINDKIYQLYKYYKNDDFYVSNVGRMYVDSMIKEINPDYEILVNAYIKAHGKIN